MAFLMLSYPLLLLILRQYPDAYIPMSLVNVSGPLTVAPTLFFLFSQLLARKPQWQAFVAVLLCQIIGAGMAMNTLRAVLKALLGQRGEFLRTPKWGDSKPTAGTYRLKPDVGVLIDLLWGFYCLVLVAVGLTYGHMFIIAYGLMSCIGSWWVALWTIWPSLRAAFQTRRAALTAKSA
jgi:hypothetical protein